MIVWMISWRKDYWKTLNISAKRQTVVKNHQHLKCHTHTLTHTPCRPSHRQQQSSRWQGDVIQAAGDFVSLLVSVHAHLVNTLHVCLCVCVCCSDVIITVMLTVAHTHTHTRSAERRLRSLRLRLCVGSGELIEPLAWLARLLWNQRDGFTKTLFRAKWLSVGVG